jgi:cell surface protein SprA
MTLDGNRDFEERKMRSGSTFGGNIDPTFFKNFMLNRTYNMTWNMTKGLNLNLSATNMARVDEVRGYWVTADSLERDSIGSVWENLAKVGRDVERGHDNLLNIGRNINYNHRVALSYQLPFSKYEWTNFISGNVNYAASFTWDQAPENNPNLGATIANTQTIQAMGRLDLKNLYKKVGPIKKMMDDIEKRERERERARRQKERERERAKQGEDARPGPPVRPNAQTTPEDTSRFKVLKHIGQEIGRIIFSVKDVNLTLNRQSNTLLPGYMPKTDNLGLDFRYDHPYDTAFDGTPLLPPTLGFVFGSQKDIRELGAEQGWITRDTTLSSFFAQNLNEQLSARTSVELFKGFRVDFNAQRQRTENFSELFRWDPDSLMYLSTDALVNGSFTMTYLFINTAFEKNEDFSQSFFNFSESRNAISRRLGNRNPYVDSLGLPGVTFKNGYSSQHQDVLLPSLLAAYSVMDSSKVSLNAFPAVPLPNWNVNYNALNNLPFLKRYLNSFTVRHTYRGTYSINSYTNNLNAERDRFGFVTNTEEKLDVNGNTFQDFFPENNIEIVRIREDFSPFLGVQMNFKNGMTGAIDYKKGRDLAFSTGTMQLTETRREDLSVTMGYRVDKLGLKFRFLGKDFDLQNSMNAQFRMTIGDNRTRNRTLDSSQPPEYTQGSYNLVIEPTIDYVLNQQVNLQLFFKTNVTKPYTSNTFRTGFTSGGFKLRFTLN